MKKQQIKRKEERAARANQPKKPRKQYQRFFYAARPLPPDPAHAIKIEQGYVKVVFD